MKRIFIGGMGRSGTSILLHSLYRHPDIYAVPIETKFLVEEDGFEDLITALTSRFSTSSAPVVFRRFQELMYRQTTGLVESKFLLQEHLPGAIFENYVSAVDNFIDDISGDAMYHPSRTILLAATRRFISALFDAQAIQAEKSIWVEKTPSNYWRLPFLRELWPDCYFVHALRDPRDIFLSLLERGWLPSQIEHSIKVFASQLAALLAVRRSFIDDARFIEVRLEELVEMPQKILDDLADKLEVARFDKKEVSEIVTAMDTYYAGQGPIGITLNGQQSEMIHELLSPSVAELGYPARWQARQPRVSSR